MKWEEYKKGIEDLKNTKLTQSEKFDIKSNLDFYIQSNQVNSKPEKSNWYINYFSMHSKMYTTAFSMCLLLLVGFGSYNKAQTSLPGDTLYSLKVNVIEPLRYTGTLNELSKANLLVQNFDTRLREAELLQVQGKLTGTVSDDVLKAIGNSSYAVSEAVSNFSQNGTGGDDNELGLDFEAKVSAHSRIIDSIDDSKDEQSNLKKIKRIIDPSREVEQSFSQDVSSLSASMPMMAKSSEIQNTLLTSTEVGSSTIESIIDTKIISRRNDTEKIIKSLKKDIERHKNSGKTNHKFLQDAEGVLLEAENFLSDADTQIQAGNVEMVKFNLDNSRKKLKEARVVFEVSQDLSRGEDD